MRLAWHKRVELCKRRYKYISESEAKLAIKKLSDAGNFTAAHQVHLCKVCGFWHVACEKRIIDYQKVNKMTFDF